MENHLPKNKHRKETQATKLGPIKLTIEDKKNVKIPVWAGLGAIALGSALLFIAGKKS